MSNSFEDAMHQGFSAADAAAEQAEFIQAHGCLDCPKYTAAHDLHECQSCDTSYKGGRA